MRNYINLYKLNLVLPTLSIFFNIFIFSSINAQAQGSFIDPSCKEILSPEKLETITEINIAYYGKESTSQSYCNYDILKSNLKHMPNLNAVDLSDFVSNSYPEIFSSIIHIKRLKLRFDKIKYIPPELKNFKNLEELSVEVNITSLPDWFKNLKNLQILDIYSTKIDHLDNWLFDDMNLEYLFIPINLSKYVPTSFCDKKNRTIEFGLLYEQKIDKATERKLLHKYKKCNVQINKNII